jgi:hypothetical protein
MGAMDIPTAHNINEKSGTKNHQKCLGKRRRCKFKGE